jgi:ADP-heptose:LPS heptosyltransferase
VQGNPYIDKIHILENDLKGLIRILKDEKFDYIVDLHQSLRSRVIRFSLVTPSGGFPKINARKYLLTRFKIDIMPDVHVVDRYFKAASALGIIDDGKGLDYFIPSADEFDITSLPVAYQKGYAAFVIGAKHTTKRLPDHKVISLCRKLDMPVILLGGPEDAVMAEKIARECGPSVISMCGHLNLNQSASVVKQAKVVISHDTGLMHIAAAFRKKIVSIWGNTVPKFGMYPYMPGDEDKSAIIEVTGLKCRPCSKLGYDRCPKGHFHCMEWIDEEAVRSAVSG